MECRDMEESYTLVFNVCYKDVMTIFTLKRTFLIACRVLKYEMQLFVKVCWNILLVKLLVTASISKIFSVV